MEKARAAANNSVRSFFMRKLSFLVNRRTKCWNDQPALVFGVRRIVDEAEFLPKHKIVPHTIVPAFDFPFTVRHLHA
jgi:hypothetical protein